MGGGGKLFADFRFSGGPLGTEPLRKATAECTQYGRRGEERKGFQTQGSSLHGRNGTNGILRPPPKEKGCLKPEYINDLIHKVKEKHN